MRTVTGCAVVELGGVLSAAWWGLVCRVVVGFEMQCVHLWRRAVCCVWGLGTAGSKNCLLNKSKVGRPAGQYGGHGGK